MTNPPAGAGTPRRGGNPIIGLFSKGGMGSQWIPLASLGMLAYLVARPILLSDEFPLAADHMGHMLRLWFAAESLSQTGEVAGWLPFWSNGIPAWQYYPPLSHWLLLPVQWISDDVVTSYKVFLPTVLWTAAIGVYLIAKPRWGALAGMAAAALYITAPFNLRTIFWAGSLPRTLLLAIAPFGLWLALRMSRRRSREFILLAIVIASLILGHVMQAVIDLIGLGLALAPFALRRRSWSRLTLVAAAIAVGTALSLFWTLPSVTHVELAGMPYIVPDRVQIYSETWAAFSPTARDQALEQTYFGLALVLLGMFGGIFSLFHRPPERLLIGGLLLSGVATAILTLGVHLPGYSWLPLSDSLLPRRLFNWSALPLALLAASPLGSAFGPGARISARLRISGLVAFGVVLLVAWSDVAPYLGLARTRDHAPLRKLIRQLPRADSSFDQGRLISHTASALSEVSFFPVVDNNLAMAGYWCCTAGTPHEARLAEATLQLREADSSSYLFHNLALWNVRGAILDLGSDLEQVYAGQGFQPLADDGARVVYWSDNPSAYVQATQQPWLVIGHGGPAAAGVFPGFAVGWSPYVEDYDLEYLTQFEGLLLYGYQIRSRPRAEELLFQLIGEGMTVFVDMTARYDSLFGVSGLPHDFSGKVRLRPAVSGGRQPTLEVDLESMHAEAEWRAPVYAGPLEPWLIADSGETEVTVVGRLNLGSGSVHFLGLNLLEYSLRSGDPEARLVLLDLFGLGQRGDHLDQLALAPLALSQEVWRYEEISFGYHSRSPVRALISMTFTPRWSAYLDGEPIQAHNHENLIELLLPAGKHQVRLRYGNSRLQRFSNALSLLALAAIAAVGLYWARLSRGAEFFTQGLIHLLKTPFAESSPGDPDR